jgi:hypothetical protein
MMRIVQPGQLVVAFWRSAQGEDKKDAAKVLVGAMFWLIQARWMADEVMCTLEELAADSETDLRATVALIARFRSLKWRGVSRKVASRLRSLDKRVYGDTVESQVRRVILLGSWEDIDHSSGQKRHTRALRQLARSAIENPATLGLLLPSLSSGPGFALFGFGRVLGDHDEPFAWWPAILASVKAAGTQQNPELAAGYLNAVFHRDRTLWNRRASFCGY